jgi:hypothetical protein
MMSAPRVREQLRHRKDYKPMSGDMDRMILNGARHAAVDCRTRLSIFS